MARLETMAKKGGQARAAQCAVGERPLTARTIDGGVTVLLLCDIDLAGSASM